MTKEMKLEEKRSIVTSTSTSAPRKSASANYDKQYDFSLFNDFLNNFILLDDLVIKLSELAMNYALLIDGNNAEQARRDIDLIVLLYHEFKGLKEISA